MQSKMEMGHFDELELASGKQGLCDHFLGAWRSSAALRVICACLLAFFSRLFHVLMSVQCPQAG